MSLFTALETAWCSAGITMHNILNDAKPAGYCNVELTKEEQDIVNQLIAIGYDEGDANRFILYCEDYAERGITFDMPEMQLVELFYFTMNSLKIFRVYREMAQALAAQQAVTSPTS